MADVHVVPSGKVYRQIFDAEVQLVRSLGEARRKHIPYDVSLDSGKDPLLRGADTAGAAGQWQGVWPQEMTHLSSGVPGVSRELSSCVRRNEDNEDQIAAEEVRGLSDVIVADKGSSDIIERLAESKRQRHTEAMTQLHQELVTLSEDFEPRFKETGESLLRTLAQSDKEIEQLLRRIDSYPDLETFTLQSLHKLWDSVNGESLQRRKHIQDLDETYQKYESERAVMIGGILKRYTKMLERISYLMPADIHRLIDKEAMMINQALLANRRAVGRLFVNLVESNLQKELSRRLSWEGRLQDWKKIKIQASIDQFKVFMNSQRVQNPEAVQRTLASVRKAQQSLTERRMSTLQSLSSSIKPPVCTKAVVSEWYSSLSAVNEQIDTLHVDTVTALRSSYERVWQDCLAEIEKFKEEVSACALTELEIQSIVTRELLPLVGASQSQEEARLEDMDKAFEEQAQRARAQSKALFKFTQGAAHLWELHSARLQRQEQLLQYQLDEVRHAHDQDNQGKEASLDIIMDKLRQESTEEALKTALEKALNFLEEIKKGYVSFYRDQVDKVESYPAMVLEDLHKYSTAVSKFFHVKEIYKQETEGHIKKSHMSQERADLLIPSLEDSSESQNDPHNPSQISETFTTSRGNVYSVCSSCVQVSEDVAREKSTSYMELALFPGSAQLTELQNSVRLAFFEHLEDRYETIPTNSVNIVAAKKDELKSELELRLHLHQPRAKRIEMDIHNVRSAELVLHRDRVERHCKGITEALNALKTEFVALRDEQKKLTEDFRTHIYSMENVFINASKSSVLVGLCSSLHTDLDKHLGLIQTSLRQYRQKLESTLGRLRESNAEFIKSFRLFSEGGNFTPEEIEVFQRRLEKTSSHIDSTDELIMLDMEGMESKCLEQATEVINKFEDKFHHLTVDLNFMEKIQRLLTNTQVEIKSEVTKSNKQMETLNTYLSQFESKIDACAKLNIDKEAVTPDDLHVFTQFIMEELKKRCQYLECLTDLFSTALAPEAPLQGPIAAAARTETLKLEKLGAHSTDSLLQPSKMGRPATEDVAVGVIQHILQIQKYKDSPDFQGEPVERSQTVTAGTWQASPAAGTQGAGLSPSRPPSEGAAGLRSTGSATGLRTEAPLKRVSSTCVKRFSKPTRFDKRFQVFGPKPEQQPVTFKGVINSVLWKANDVLLAVAEDFYKKKERRAITRPQYLQETFEHCAEVLNSKLLSYQSQTLAYHNACLQEFREQLRQAERCLSAVPGRLIGHLLEQHLHELGQATGRIRHHFRLAQQQSEDRQNDHWNKLRPSLGHPDNVSNLQSLCSLEEERQEQQGHLIDSTKGELQKCVEQRAEEFVAVLAALTERLLLLLDDFLTVDDVQTGQTEAVKEKTSTLIRRKQAGLPLEEKHQMPLIQRDSRTWPGIPYFESRAKTNGGDPRRETASVKTAKTTLGHLSAVEARDAAHQRFQGEYNKETLQTEEESEAQWRRARRWEASWREAVMKIKQLYL
ncbi:coiled-coil domain-containing protein 180 [Amia ocellicauda]|uniref:coiled-coil domain-containing protein 180 n=1 Tax=Amia ocellicauda TaxID=2972642 RepID=UPI0034644078